MNLPVEFRPVEAVVETCQSWPWPLDLLQGAGIPFVLAHAKRLKTLTYPSLLVVDEIGYLPNPQSGAILFFQFINRRHERASTCRASVIAVPPERRGDGREHGERPLRFEPRRPG